MAQRQFKTTDTSPWPGRFGTGSDGAASINTSTDATANTTATVTSGSTALTAGSGTGFASGNLILIHQTRNGGTTVGAWELNKISSIGGGTNWTLAYATVNAYDTTAQVYLLKQYTTVTVNGSQTLTAAAWAGATGGIVAFLANTSITVTGTITVSGEGCVGGTGNNSGSGSFCGEGTTSGITQARQTPSSNEGGGISAGNGGAGGGGGNGGSGTAATGGSGQGGGGATAGLANLTVMVFGGGGGGGLDASNSSGAIGGGIVLLIAPTITITGALNGNGLQGGAANWPGGGSAVASILLKGRNLTLGSSLITASGGAARAGVGTSGAGGGGRIHADYSQTLSGTTSPTIDSTLDTIFNNSGFLSIFM